MNTRSLMAGLAALLIIPSVVSGCGTDQTNQQASSQAGAASTLATSIASKLGAASPVATSTGASPSSEDTVGTSGGSSGTLDVSQVNPCSLLSKADIEAVMGTVNYDPQLSVPMSEAGLFHDHECWYVNDVVLKNQDNTGLHQVDLWVSEPDFWSTSQSTFGPGQPVSGIGDEAFTADFNLGVGVWVLLKNRAGINVNVFPKDPNLAEQLVRKAIAKLP